ncbi:TPA: antA/AntB antirepressor family protein [Clostridioides difficile]
MEDLKIVEEKGIIKIYTTDEDVKVVNGRELWEGLGVKQQFSDWIETNLRNVDADKNEFYLLKGKTSKQGGRPTDEYIIKLEIAKEICMIAGISPRASKELRENSKKYRKYLIEVEKKYQKIKETLDTSKLSLDLQMFKRIFDTVAKQELEQNQLKQVLKETKEEIQGIREVISLSPKNWRDDTNKIIKQIGNKQGEFNFIRNKSYELLDNRFGVDLKTRLNNKRKRMREEGISKSKIDKTNFLDVIAEDKKLIEGYISIVKDMAIKYGILIRNT